jgi:hypothetical protein
MPFILFKIISFIFEDEEINFILSFIYCDDKELNYHYIYLLLYNPKGIVGFFFFQLGPSSHHPHVDGLQRS